MGQIIDFKKIKNKRITKKQIVYLIFFIIVLYVLYSIYLLLRTPTDTVLVDTGVLTLEESSTGYIIRNEVVLKGENYKSVITPIISEGEKAAKDQKIFRYSSSDEGEIKNKIEEINLKIQETLENQPSIFSTDVKNIEKQIDEKVQNLRNITDIHTIIEYKKEIQELVNKKAKIAGSLGQSSKYIVELTKQREEYEEKLMKDSEYISAPISGVVSYRVDGLENVLTTEDFSKISEQSLENLNLKTGKIISTSQEERKSNR